MMCEACHKRKVFKVVYGTGLCKPCIYKLLAIVEEMEKKGGDCFGEERPICVRHALAE